MSYQKILVPVDFSGINERALSKAKELSALFDCDITMAHVIDYMPPSYVRVELPDNYASESMMIERSEKHLVALCEKADLKDAEVIVRVGRPKDVLLDIQQAINADLIIMAKHSQSGLEKLLGSTTNGVLSKVGCDVLVLPE
jgi:nucleotide-binding universal stress UspA family protein